MKIQAILADDEKIAREVLENYIHKYCPQITIIGKAENYNEAVKIIHELKPLKVALL